MAQRDRDESGRAKNARPRDALGRPLPRGSEGVPRLPDDLDLRPPRSLRYAQDLLDRGLAFNAHEVLEAAWKNGPEKERMLWQGARATRRRDHPRAARKHHGRMRVTRPRGGQAETERAIRRRTESTPTGSSAHAAQLSADLREGPGSRRGSSDAPLGDQRGGSPRQVKLLTYLDMSRASCRFAPDG